MFRRSNTFSVNLPDVATYRKDSQHLQNIFYSLKENPRKNVDLTFAICTEIVINELNVKYNTVSFLIKYTLPECLCYYMQMWKGWKSDLATFSDFKSYLERKIGFIVNHQQMFCDSAKNIEDLKCLTESNTSEPYTLTIYENPTDLSNLSFQIKDVKSFVKQYERHEWLPLNLQEFINFPNVSVSVSLPFLKFARINLHEYKKDIRKSEANLPSSNTDSVRTNVVQQPVQEYSIDFVLNYFDQFFKMLKSLDDIHKSNPGEISVTSDLEIICEEFVQDLKEFALTENNICIPSAISCNIGRTYYMKSKKLEEMDKSGHINCREVLVPSLLVIISKFEAKFDGSTSNILFGDLNSADQMTSAQKQCFVYQIKNSIVYSCQECPVNFTGENSFKDITEHFQSKHGGELPLICNVCQQKFDMPKLLGARWTHTCNKVSNHGGNN